MSFAHVNIHLGFVVVVSFRTHSICPNDTFLYFFVVKIFSVCAIALEFSSRFTFYSLLWIKQFNLQVGQRTLSLSFLRVERNSLKVFFSFPSQTNGWRDFINTVHFSFSLTLLTLWFWGFFRNWTFIEHHKSSLRIQVLQFTHLPTTTRHLSTLSVRKTNSLLLAPLTLFQIFV